MHVWLASYVAIFDNVWLYFYRSSKRICLRNSMGFMQNTSPLRRLPSDVTLKLPDGTIKAQKMMLAFISPVFEKMFYGNFKEAKSKVVQLPGDSHKIMKLLLEIVFEESCEMESLDDIIPLMEVVERYQINKAPIQQMCDEAILAQMNSNNYYILLPKFASLMHEANIEVAAQKVMSFTHNNFIASYNQAKFLPEEILLPLLQHKSLENHDLKIFEFLLKWHEHQTQSLGKSLQLTSRLFECVRYTRIIPQILTSKVASCNLVDRQLLSDAYHFIYSMPGEINDDRSYKSFSVSIFRKPMGNKVSFNWEGFNTVTLVRDYPSAVRVDVNGKLEAVPPNQYIVKSAPLNKDDIYWFRFTRLSFSVICRSSLPELLLMVTDVSQHCLLSTPISTDSAVTLYIHGRFVFLKLTDSSKDVVTSTFSVTGNNPFMVRICKPLECSTKATFSFTIS